MRTNTKLGIENLERREVFAGLAGLEGIAPVVDGTELEIYDGPAYPIDVMDSTVSNNLTGRGNDASPLIDAGDWPELCTQVGFVDPRYETLFTRVQADEPQRWGWPNYEDIFGENLMADGPAVSNRLDNWEHAVVAQDHDGFVIDGKCDDAVEFESVEIATQPGSLSDHQPSASCEIPAVVTPSFENTAGFWGVDQMPPVTQAFLKAQATDHLMGVPEYLDSFGEQFNYATSADETGHLPFIDHIEFPPTLGTDGSVCAIDNPGVAEVSRFDGPWYDDIRGVLNGPDWDKGLIHDTGQVGQVAAGTYDWETVYGF